MLLNCLGSLLLILPGCSYKTNLFWLSIAVWQATPKLSGLKQRFIMIFHGAVDWLLTLVVVTGGLSHACSQTAAGSMSCVTSLLTVDTSCQLSSHEGCSQEGHPRVTETVSYDLAQPSQAIAFTTFYWSKSGHRTSPDSRERDHKRKCWYSGGLIHLWPSLGTSCHKTVKDCWIVS